MPSVLPRMLTLIIVAAVLLLIATVLPVAAQDTSPTDRLILAFYYAWYDWATWSQTLCDQPQNLYVSADAAAVDRHLREAQSVGIDAFAAAWYGPDLVDNPTEPNVAMLLTQASAYAVDVAVVLDMSTPDHLLTGTDVTEALLHLRDQHQARPAYLRVDDRPVVLFLGQDRLSLASWEAVRNQVDPDRNMIWIAEAGDAAALETFDGLYLYEIAHAGATRTLTPLQLNRWAAEIRQWRIDHDATRFWVATVYPGYDESYVTDEEDEDLIVVQERDNGDAYREGWAAADATSPDWVAIRSYNEWPLCTYTEPSVRYGSSYLDMTADLIAQYRRPMMPTPTPAASPTVTLTVMPTATPTVTMSTDVPTQTPEATATVTPTATLTPTATPYRLSTPTPTLEPSVGRTTEATGTLSPQPTPTSGRAAGPSSTLTPTLMPRLPVEGSAPRRCSLLPLWLTGATLLIRRHRRHDVG